MSSIESVDLSIDSINKSEETSPIERKEIEGLSIPQDNVYLGQLLNLTYDTLTQVLKEGRNLSKASISGTSHSSPLLCASASPKAASSSKPTATASAGSSPADNIVPDNYLDALKELESLLSVQAGNWNQFNENSYNLLTYMIGFADKFPDSPVVTSPIYIKVEAALVENYLAAVYVEDPSQFNQAQNDIITLFGSWDNVPDTIKPMLQGTTYFDNKYVFDGQVVPEKIMHELQVNNLFSSGINSLFKIIYSEEINQIMADMDEATFLDGDFQIYLQLAEVFAQKSGDSENEIAGCANMLMELSTGSTSVGNAENSLSEIVNFATDSDLLNNIDEGLDETVKDLIDAVNKYHPTQQQWYDYAKQMGISDEARDAIADLYNVLTPIYQSNNNSINFCLIDKTTQTRIVEDFTIINGDQNADIFMMDWCNLSVPGLLNLLNEYVDEESSNHLSDVNSGLIEIAALMISDVNQYGITQDKWNNYAAQMGISDAARDAITDLYNILVPVYEKNNSSINFSKLDSKTQTQIIDDLNTINNDPNAVSFMKTYLNTDVSAFLDVINDYEYQYPYDAAQNLAQNLLFLRETGEIYGNTIFPGLLDLTSKLLGDSSNPNGGDFFSAVGISLEQLEGAAEGNTDDETALIEGIVNLVPSDDSGETSELSLINNDLSGIAMYFDENTQQEQANVQYITATDKEILSFLKELYDNPTKFVEAIQKNLNQANQ